MTGVELAVFDNASLLCPRRLPAPFDIDRHTEVGQSTYESQGVGGWTFAWTAGEVVLNLSVWALDGEHPEGCGTTGGSEVSVRGVTGRLCSSDPSHVLLSWTDGESIRILELSDVGGSPISPNLDVVTIADQLDALH